MSLAELSPTLRRGPDGVWRAGETPPLSYPDEGNDACFRVEDASFWFRHRNDCIAAVVRAAPPGGTILDVGGGNGFVARRLIDEGFDAAVMEPGEDGARNALRARRIPEVICSTLEAAAFPAASVPAVGLFDVVEHVADDRALVAHVRSVLRPSGMLYLTVPAHAWLWSAVDDASGHFRRHDRATVAALLGDGFEVVRSTYFFRPLVLPILALRAIPYRLRLVKRGGVMSPESEHGTGDGAAVRVLRSMLAREAASIAAGGSRRVGASLLVAARARG